jgi:tripartite-type tricarboxylate transporter receptor subunit TctC
MLAKPSWGQAPAYPARTVTIVSPWAPGGLNYLLARQVGDGLAKRLGQAFVVESRPGASSVTGTAAVAHAAADGHTLLVNTQTMATNASLHRALTYDSVADFQPLALIARSPLVLIVHAGLPIRSLQEFAAVARAKAGALTFGSSGAGTSQHLCGEMLKIALDIPMTHVPYNGNAAALNDVAGGHVSALFCDPLSAKPLIQSGKIRAIGVSTRQRIDALADVPALAEVGAPDFDASSWYMLFAPARAPLTVMEMVRREAYAILQDAAVRRDLSDRGLQPTDVQSLAELKRFYLAEIANWGGILQKVGLAGTI